MSALPRPRARCDCRVDRLFWSLAAAAGACETPPSTSGGIIATIGAPQEAAVIGSEDDAVEFAARYVAALQKIDLGEMPAIEVVLACSDEVKAAFAQFPQLQRAIANVGDRYGAPIPPEHEIVATIELPPAALVAFDAIAADPLVSQRRPLDGPRA